MSHALRRLVATTLGIWLSSILVFLLLRILPGDIATTRLGVNATPEALANLRAEYGFDRSLWSQYLQWVSGALRGDLGRSLVSGEGVLGDITSRIDVTLPLIAFSSILAVILAMFVGPRAALRRRSVSGVTTVLLAQIGIAVPTFVVGVIFITVFAVQLGLLPAGGFPIDGWRNPTAATKSLILPVLTLALTQTAILVRFARSESLDFIASDAFRTARAVGRTADSALATASRLILSPVLQVTALQMATLITGAVVVESVFALPGLGSMLVRDIANRDITKVQSTLLLVICVVFVIRLILDFVNDRLDPRRLT